MSHADHGGTTSHTFPWDKEQYPDEVVIGSAVAGCVNDSFVFAEDMGLDPLAAVETLLAKGNMGHVRPDFIRVLQKEGLPLLREYSFNPDRIRANGTPISKVDDDPHAGERAAHAKARMEGYAQKMLHLLESVLPGE